MEKLMRIPFWLFFAAIRAVFWIIGWFFVPLTLINDGARSTPPLWRSVYGNVEDIAEEAQKNRWTKYLEMAWRNPTNGLKNRIQQPVPEVRPNPDALVRDDSRLNDTASRWMAHGVFWEYWWMGRIDWTIRGKHYRWFEFRIGWKFVDGNTEFFPTVQFGPRSS